MSCPFASVVPVPLVPSPKSTVMAAPAIGGMSGPLDCNVMTKVAFSVATGVMGVTVSMVEDVSGPTCTMSIAEDG